MKVFMKSSLASLFLMMSLSSQSFAMGQQAKIFESSKAAGIWNHPNDFYLRMDLSELGDLKDQTFLWAGLHEEAPGIFKGEVVADQFGPNEKRFPARAKLLDTTETASYYRIEILNADKEVIKEVFLKGPVRVAGPGLPTE